MGGKDRRSQSKLSVWTRRMSEHRIQVRDAALVSKESNHGRHSTSPSGPYVHTQASATCLHTHECTYNTPMNYTYMCKKRLNYKDTLRVSSDNDFFSIKSYHPKQVISLSDTHFLIWKIRRLASNCGALTPTTILNFSL